MTSEQPTFSVTVHQNEYLPAGGREVDAILAVTATGAPAPAAVAAGHAEVILIDTSGSMAGRGKMEAAIQATVTAIDTLADGTLFAVVAGSAAARMVFPRNEELCAADPQTRNQAKAAVRRLSASGGTAIGRWLTLAGRLLTDHPDAVRHAILLTDGRNGESPVTLQGVLDACAGVFTCDCRGIGVDWEPAELHRVAAAMLGTAAFVREPSGLAADFRAMTETSMRKAVPDVSLRLWTPRGATVHYVKQVEPTIIDLTGKRTESGPRAADYPTGSWGAERRDYHLHLELPVAGDLGEEMLAARVSLVAAPPGGGPAAADAAVLAGSEVLAEWTEDEALSTRINSQVAHYTDQAELAADIQAGLKALQAGDDDTATARLGLAVRRAHEAGDQRKSEQLSRIVEVLDTETGTVRLRGSVDRADAIELDIDSVRTVRTREDPGATGPGTATPGAVPLGTRGDSGRDPG